MRHISLLDLGHGEADNSMETIPYEPPSLNTTKRLIAAADNNDLVLHVGDICYAEGYAATVSSVYTYSLFLLS